MGLQFASITDLTNRFDPRLVSQLSSSDNSGNLNVAVVNILLQDATSELLLSVLVGQVYSQSDIQTLYNQGDNFVIRIVCELAMKNLFALRGEGISDNLINSFKFSELLLEQLKNGNKIFNTTNGPNANLTSTTPNVIHLSQQQYKCEGSQWDIGFWKGRQGQNWT